MFIYFEHVERGLGCDLVDSTVTPHLGKVPHPAQQTVGNSRGASGPVGKLDRAFVVNLDTQYLGGALNDEFQLFVGIELQPQQDAEAGAQGRGEQTSAGGRGHKGEWTY